MKYSLGLKIYRTFPNIKKGANLTMYCILAELEEFRRRNMVYPETLFVQLDGGSENANKYVLGNVLYK